MMMVAPPFKCLDLTGNILPSINGKHFDPMHIFCKFPDFFRALDGQFSCRRKYDCLRFFIILNFTFIKRRHSFGIPLLMKVDPNNKKTQAIVLSPTRELAIQSAEEIRKLAKYMHGIKVLPIYGGQDISRQIKALKGGATIIIGTPGRVMDHLRRKTIRCDYINTIVLDEADEMLNMGFREDIETILSYIPDEDRQTVLFSATMPKPILEILPYQGLLLYWPP